MERKMNYAAPQVTIVAFHAEQGFTESTPKSLGLGGQNSQGVQYGDNALEGRTEKEGYFGGGSSENWL